MSDLTALLAGAIIVALVNTLPIVWATRRNRASTYEDRYDLLNL